MAKLGDIRRILAEDFDDKDRNLIEKLGEVENRFKDDVVEQFNGNVDMDNLKDDLVFIQMTVNCCCVPIGNNKFRTNVLDIGGLNIIDAVNLDDATSSGYPTAHPWIIRKTGTGQVVEIIKILGLIKNKKYRLRVRVYSKT